MIKLAKDKIIALFGAGLLGYYLAISVFRGMIWNNFCKILPPINNRHLPDNHVGWLGAILGVILVYVVFSLFVEKKSFKSHKKEYLLTLTLLIITPLILAGVFRVQAVNFVNKAENSIPTEFRISFHDVNRSIMFQTGPSQASGFSKDIVADKEDLEGLGQLIKNMELKEVVQGVNSWGDPIFTLWVNYRVEGKWYSKIINYQEGAFVERVVNNHFSLYESEKLEETVEELILAAGNIKNYNRAEIVNSQSMKDGIKQRALNDENFYKLIAFVNAKNKLKPEGEGVLRIKRVLENNVPQEESEIYGIRLLKDMPQGRTSQNFMVYDQANQILMFEGEFYQADLSEIIE